MDDLISRRAVIDRINKQREHLHPDTDTRDFIGNCAYNICIEFIERLPSAQPEIIRCKDCKYCDKGIDENDNPFLKCLGWVYGGTQKEDFCSHAERRT